MAMENALKETLIGTLSYNGQRCTALKILFVPRKHCDSFVQELVKKVEGKGETHPSMHEACWHG